jgi:hypothetical protein
MVSGLEDLLERFRRGPELMAAVLTGAAGSEVDFRPEPGHWSVREIVAHVADSEIAGCFRMRRVIAEQDPILESYDQNAWTANLDYAKRKPSQSLETFRRIRAENYELLRSLPESAFHRTGRHSERGPLSLFDLLRTYAEHAENHAQQIRRVRDAFKAQRSAGA